MKILKKIAGYFLLIVSVYLSFAALLSAFNAIARTNEELNISSASGTGYAIGTVIVYAIIIAIIYFMIKTGLKLVRKKKIEHNSIDEIGSGL